MATFPRLDVSSFRQQWKPEGFRVLSRRNLASIRAFSLNEKKKDLICTADELHYLPLPNCDWKLALWRYLPSLQAPSRNHPVLMLSGVGSNALGYDLSPESSFARYMSNQGYDSWVLEVRGSGLSTDRAETKENEKSSEQMESQTMAREQSFLDTTTKAFSKDDAGQSSAVSTAQFRQWNQSLTDIMEGAQQLWPLQPFNLNSALEDFQQQFDMFMKYDWDFDHYLEEDLPAAMEYIRSQSRPKDGKLLAIGHSMGGILLYATISRCSFNKVDPQLASVVTLASSLDYRPSNSSLRLLLPLIDPAKALNVPVIPIGPLLVIAHPLATRPPFILSWLKGQISVEDMIHPTLLEKLVMKGYETVPAKVLMQLATVFEEGGLRNRDRTLCYKDHLRHSNIPILALAADRDPICPPEAVHETVKLMPEQFVSYKVLGKPGGPHYSHYDIVGSPLAAHQVYPLIVDFLNRHDMG